MGFCCQQQLRLEKIKSIFWTRDIPPPPPSPSPLSSGLSLFEEQRVTGEGGRCLPSFHFNVIAFALCPLARFPRESQVSYSALSHRHRLATSINHFEVKRDRLNVYVWRVVSVPVSVRLFVRGVDGDERVGLVQRMLCSRVLCWTLTLWNWGERWACASIAKNVRVLDRVFSMLEPMMMMMMMTKTTIFVAPYSARRALWRRNGRNRACVTDERLISTGHFLKSLASRLERSRAGETLHVHELTTEITEADKVTYQVQSCHY